MLGGRGMEQVREFETADGRRGRRRIPVLAPFEFFASSRLIRAQFHREGAKGSRRNKFAFWRRAPAGCGPQARWLRCSLLTYRPGDSSSLAPRQRAWGPAANCEVISARALSNPLWHYVIWPQRHSHGEKLATNFTNYTKTGWRFREGFSPSRSART